jgi:hypothetical protein
LYSLTIILAARVSVQSYEDRVIAEHSVYPLSLPLQMGRHAMLPHTIGNSHRVVLLSWALVRLPRALWLDCI